MTIQAPERVETNQQIHKEMATILCGKRSVTDRYVGRTVAQARAELTDYLKIPAGSAAIMNGVKVEDKTPIQTGRLEFVQALKPKG